MSIRIKKTGLPPPVHPLVAGYLSHLTVERGLAQNTRQAYATDLKFYLQYLTTHTIKLEAVTEPDVQSYFIYLVEEKKLSDLSLARTLAALRSFHRFLQEEGVFQHNPVDSLQSPKQGRALPTVLSLAEVERMLAACNLATPLGIRNRAMVELLYSSGLRVTELVKLEVQRLDMREGFVRVTGKGAKERWVPVGESALQAVQHYLQHVRSQTAVQRGYEGLLFLGRRGKGLTRNMAFLVVQQLATLAGINRPVGPHTFRHSFATHLIEGGADLKAVQEMLGHESITTTEIYLHMDAAYLRQVHALHHPRQ